MTATPGAVPVLETARLLMRGHAVCDFPACAAMWADPGIAAALGAPPFSHAETWSRMLRYRGLWALLGFGYWAVLERETQRFVGEVGFADFRRPIDPELDGPELGWVIATSAQQRGYASEAVAAALDWGDRSLRTARTWCVIAPDNAPSLRIAARAGYVAVAGAAVNARPVSVLARPQPRRG